MVPIPSVYGTGTCSLRSSTISGFPRYSLARRRGCSPRVRATLP
jgi:hypothetical protein